MKAKFKVLEITTDHILIDDECEKYGCMSVTNDAENVVDFLLKKYLLKDKKIYYIDTDGRVDELEHNNQKFIGFKPGYENMNVFRAYKIGIEI